MTQQRSTTVLPCDIVLKLAVQVSAAADALHTQDGILIKSRARECAYQWQQGHSRPLMN